MCHPESDSVPQSKTQCWEGRLQSPAAFTPWPKYISFSPIPFHVSQRQKSGFMQIRAKNSSTAAANDDMTSIGTCRQPLLPFIKYKQKIRLHFPSDVISWSHFARTLGLLFFLLGAKGRGTSRGERDFLVMVRGYMKDGLYLRWHTVYKITVDHVVPLELNPGSVTTIFKVNCIVQLEGTYQVLQVYIRTDKHYYYYCSHQEWQFA